MEIDTPPSSPEAKADDGMTFQPAPRERFEFTIDEEHPITVSYESNELIFTNSDEDFNNCLNRMINMAKNLMGYSFSNNGSLIAVDVTRQEALNIIDKLSNANLLTVKEASDASLTLRAAGLEIEKPVAKRLGR